MKLLTYIVILLLPLVAFPPQPAMGADDEVLRTLGLPGDTLQGETPATFPRPTSKIAENRTIVTSEDIARINAHTLDEILQTVSGIQLLQMQTPGSSVFFTINGSVSRHIMVLIDGVPQNLLGADETAEIGMIPAQRIERIEIIKGAASSMWGSALGGVVNVITKSPESAEGSGGMVSTSYGERETYDLRGEASGTSDRFGYLLNGGRYRSDGLRPANDIELDNVFGKFTYAVPSGGRMALDLDYRHGSRGVQHIPERLLSDRSGSTYRTAHFSYEQPMAGGLLLDMTAAVSRKEAWARTTVNSPAPQPVFDPEHTADSREAAIRLSWGDSRTNLTAGLEYRHDNITDREPFLRFPFLNFDRTLDRYAAYLNGSWSAGRLTLIPGIRFDSIDTETNTTSYHLGATWQLTDRTLLRAYAAKGYSLPMVNFHDSLQRIWTVQAGFESNDIPWLWLKGTAFFSNTWNIESFVVPPDYPLSPVTTYESEQDRQGFELELRTLPLHHLFLSAGYMYSDVRDRSSDAQVNYIPTDSLKLALNYDNPSIGLRGTLAGNYVRWPDTTGNEVTDNAAIWDLHLNQTLDAGQRIMPEFFFSVRNLFNGGQYIDNFRKNAPRWIEGGIRVRF